MPDEKTGKQDAEFLERLRSLSLRGAQELLTGLDNLKQLHGELAEVDPADSQRQKEQFGDLVYRLAKTELEHAESLLTLGHTQANLVFEHVRSLARSARNGGEPPTKVLEFVFSETGSDEPTKQFQVYNPFEVDADARFAIDGFRNSHGAPQDSLNQALTLELRPGRAPARGHADVLVNVLLPPVTPSAGVYFAEFQVNLCGAIERSVAKRIVKLRIN